MMSHNLQMIYLQHLFLSYSIFVICLHTPIYSPLGSALQKYPHELPKRSRKFILIFDLVELFEDNHVTELHEVLIRQAAWWSHLWLIPCYCTPEPSPEDDSAPFFFFNIILCIKFPVHWDLFWRQHLIAIKLSIIHNILGFSCIFHLIALVLPKITNALGIWRL